MALTERPRTARLAAPTRVGALVVLLTLALPRGVSSETPLPPPLRPFLKGVVVSCPRAGQIWGTAEMAEALSELRQLGVEWVAIHPYGWIERDGEIRATPAAATGYLERAVSLADQAGVRLFWKPHLGYWGSFEWRGAIEFGDDEAAWRRFFDGYERFIVDQARFAEQHRVPLFAVGVETDATVGRETEWRRIIAAVRTVYRGEITYAANWDRLDAVPFWDAVDWIGVHAYFPLTEHLDPSADELRAGWDRHLAELGALSQRWGHKPILFAEIGYNRDVDAARTPWSYDVDGTPAGRRLRERLLAVALERVASDPTVRGMFWWKWMPGRRSPRNFSMRDPEATAALAYAWSATPPTGRTTSQR